MAGKVGFCNWVCSPGKETSVNGESLPEREWRLSCRPQWEVCPHGSRGGCIVRIQIPKLLFLSLAKFTQIYPGASIQLPLSKYCSKAMIYSLPSSFPFFLPFFLSSSLLASVSFGQFYWSHIARLAFNQSVLADCWRSHITWLPASVCTSVCLAAVPRSLLVPGGGEHQFWLTRSSTLFGTSPRLGS